MEIRLKDHFNSNEATIINNTFKRHGIFLKVAKVKKQTANGIKPYLSVFMRLDQLDELIKIVREKYNTNNNITTRMSYDLMVKFRKRLKNVSK